jgi:hypothetical protein
MAKQNRFARQHPAERGNDIAPALLPGSKDIGSH